MIASIRTIIFAFIASLNVIGAAAAEDGKPIQVQTNFEIDGADISQTMYTVPLGYRLEIKFFSCDAQVPTGQSVFPNIRTTGGGGSASFDFVLIKDLANNLGTDGYDLSQDVHIYADPGTGVVLEIERSAAMPGSVLGDCSFAGELKRIH